MARERLKTYWVEVPMLGQKFAVLSSNPEKIPGKLLKLDLTRILRGRGMEANVLIKKEEDNLVGEFISTSVAQSYIKRMMRKNISWVEDSFVVKCKDNQLRIKPFMITKKKVQAHRERSDVCAVPAAPIIGEAILALVLADAFLEKFGGDSIGEIEKTYDNWQSGSTA